ncbi:MAG TPA: hypothetical protein VIS96_08460 [Terrimicrobiaceae bacterium]
MKLPLPPHDEAERIAPIMVSYWIEPPHPKSFEFYGDKHALDWMTKSVQMFGYRKHFFENKRDFIVSTLFSGNQAYKDLCHLLYLQYPPPGSDSTFWKGNGALAIMTPTMYLQLVGSTDPLTIRIQVDISSIIYQLKPFLQTIDADEDT